MTETALWHFTCEHGRRGIGTRGLIVCPIRHPILEKRIAWFTELAEPDRESTGLTMEHTRCDRMVYRYRILKPAQCIRWEASAARREAPGWYLKDLESYGDPEHWWISEIPVLAQLDRTWRGSE